jgi:hypothetical protein
MERTERTEKTEGEVEEIRRFSKRTQGNVEISAEFTRPVFGGTLSDVGGSRHNRTSDLRG